MFEKLVPSVFYVDIQKSLRLFVDCLEFEIRHEEFHSDAPYCVVGRDELGVLIFQNKTYAEKDYPEFRLVTKNIELVYNKVVNGGFSDLLHPNLNIITPRPWGAKEFAITDGQVCFILQEW